MVMEGGRDSHDEREPAEGVSEAYSGIQSLDLRMQRLQIGSSVCQHGLVLPFHAASECEEFVATFSAEFSATQGPFADCFQAAIFATRKSHTSVWKDATKMEWIVSALVSNATQFLLSGNTVDVTAAGVRTSFASFFEQWIALKLHKTLYAIDWVRIRDLFYADEQKLRCHLRGRCSSCSCLGVDLGKNSVTDGSSSKSVGWIDGNRYDD